ncbi:MAG: hypothetical protein KF893_14875 [Caldilineaceae bacterium]|nr:hypothetical protein [Caldilineaceae bacterium]
MTIIQIEVPEALWEKFCQTSLPIDEVVVDAIEKAVEKSASVLSRDELVQRLIESGIVIDPEKWNNPYAQAWLNRSEQDRADLIKEMNQEWHPGSLASDAVSEGRQ